MNSRNERIRFFLSRAMTSAGIPSPRERIVNNDGEAPPLACYVLANDDEDDGIINT
jgi:hypothetical protein